MTRHLDEGIAADFDTSGQLVGVEILDAAKRVGDAKALKDVSFERFHSQVDQSSPS
jgi:uncharacterized protein YuzE